MFAPAININDSGGVQSPPEPIEIEIYTNFPAETLERNIRENAKRNLPFLTSQSFENTNEPLAIVAGGPTLKTTINELRKFKHVMVCGSAHDHLISQGIKPSYAVFCDGMPHPPFFSEIAKNCQYLLATQCDPSLFDHLADRKIMMWDCEDAGLDVGTYAGRKRIVGGSTVAMRAPALGMLLGFSDFHFFGVDSSFEDEIDRHAYDYADESDVLPARMVEFNGRLFKTCNAFVAQAQDFQSTLKKYGTLFNVTVHGDSLLRAVWMDMVEKRDALFKREKAA
jgi:hypothetical protein